MHGVDHVERLSEGDLLSGITALYVLRATPELKTIPAIYFRGVLAMLTHRRGPIPAGTGDNGKLILGP